MLTHSASKLLILNANNLISRDLHPATWPRPFARDDMARGARESWQEAFGATGRPERFYPHRIDFGVKPHLATDALPQLMPAWGGPETSWPLIYVSAHGYGVPQAKETPPMYYWSRFAQKSTNAAKVASVGPRGPALRGWDTTSHMEAQLGAAGIHVRGNARVRSVRRDEMGVYVATEAVGSFKFDKLVLATDLPLSLGFMDSSQQAPATPKSMSPCHPDDHLSLKRS